MFCILRTLDVEFVVADEEPQLMICSGFFHMQDSESVGMGWKLILYIIH